MTLTSLSERKLHPFFSFQQRNCFQKDGVVPHVIWLYLFIKDTNERDHILGARGKTLGSRTASAIKDRIPAGGRGREDPGREEPCRDARLSVQPKGGGTSTCPVRSICGRHIAR